MPTLTFYVTDDVAVQLQQVLRKRSQATGVKVSRGDLITPFVKKLHKQEFAKNGNGHAQPVAPAAVAEVNEEEKQ